MLRCGIRRTHLRAFKYPRRAITPRCVAANKLPTVRKEYSTIIKSPELQPPSHGWDLEQAARLSFPGGNERRNPAKWIALLESGLPPHLRQPGKSQSDVNMYAEDIAEVLLAAQGLLFPKNGIDLLSYLGIHEGRWSAVVWLVKYLVESFGSPHARSERLSQTLCSWSNEMPLNELTRNAIELREHLSRGRVVPSVFPSSSQTLDDLTSDLRPENLSRTERLQRDALGQIWRSLGNMTMSCADGEIKPEILEIIAYLHHTGIMPSSIYNHKPSADVTAIQQTPMLNLFSSRILTSLSDAAWRAHEKLIVEDAKAKGGDYASLRPETPGTAFKVNIAGLRPEVWMELVLWSCLHGGWILEGANILCTMYSEPNERQWQPISWRSLVPREESEDQDWDKLTYIFNTRAPSTMDHNQPSSDVSIRRTISSEVVNAYIDALLGVVHVGVGIRGVSLNYVVRQLGILKSLLGRSGLALGAGSWDAVVLRLFDLQEGIADQRTSFQRLVGLSPAMGREVESSNVRTVPSYVLDGSAAILGLSHRALRLRVKAADIEGALKVFHALQARTDEDKRRSVVDFLQTQQSLAHNAAKVENGLFTSNFPGIDYPAFDAQIPPTILGPFLELVMDARAYDFGKWLLYSEEVDGPVIPPRLYGDDAITPALIRFATETNDKSLLSKITRARSVSAEAGEPILPRQLLQKFFESQVSLCRWDAAVRILQHMKETKYAFWNTVNLAYLARVMLLQVNEANAGRTIAKENLARAKELFANMVQGEYERTGERRRYVQRQVSVLLTVLAVVDNTWAEFCLRLQPLEGHYTFDITDRMFDPVLDGVVEAYGSVAGRRLLGIFWSHQVRQAQRISQRGSPDTSDSQNMARFRSSVLDDVERQRTVLQLPGQAESKVIIYGGLRPNLMTIRIIFRKALREFRGKGHMTSEQDKEVPKSVSSSADLLDTPPTTDDEPTGNVDLSPSGMIVWAIRRLRDLGMADEDIREELDATLSEQELQGVQAELPHLFEQADVEEDGDELPSHNRA